MLTAIERTGGHYEVQRVDFGKVYRWCPEHVNIGTSTWQPSNAPLSENVTRTMSATLYEEG